VCTVCALPPAKLDALERACVEGQPFAALAAQHGLTKWSVMRHVQHCLPKELAETVAAERLLSREGLLDAMVAHTVAGQELLARCRDAGDAGVEIRAYDAQTRAWVALARVTGEMPAGVSLSIGTLQIQEAQRVVAIIRPILRDHPELQYAIAAALAAGDGESAT
jgi:hypothetical protein